MWARIRQIIKSVLLFVTFGKFRRPRLKRPTIVDSTVMNAPAWRAMVAALVRLAYIFSWRQRKRLAEKLERNGSVVKLPSIPDELGYVAWPPNFDPIVSDTVKLSRDIFEEATLAAASTSAKKTYLVDIPLKDRFSPDSPYLKLALHPAVIRMVSSYLGSIPVLCDISMRHSPNTDQVGGSQFFHHDQEDLRMVKGFLFISDATEESGPLTALRADRSTQIESDHGSFRKLGRLTDDYVGSLSSPDELTQLYGASGTLAFLDVARCLHFGSRPSTESRLISNSLCQNRKTL